MSVGIVLSIIFTVLKLTGYIGWTWPQVLIPFFIELVVDTIILVGGLTILVLINAQSNSK